jgi:hypothetical protein
MIWVVGSCCGFAFYFVATAVLGGWNVLWDPQYLLFIGGVAAFFGLLHAIGEIVGGENADSAAEPSQPAADSIQPVAAPKDAFDEIPDTDRGTHKSDGVTHP